MSPIIYPIFPEPISYKHRFCLCFERVIKRRMLSGCYGTKIAVLLGMMKRHFKSQRVRVDGGFSMVECMVVLAILGILAAIAVPSFNAWVPSYQLKNAAGEVYSALQLAKLTAVKENANVVIWFNTAGNNYRAYVDDGAGGGVAGNNTQDGTEKTLREGTLEANVDMFNTLFSTWSNQTVFNSRGLASGGWGVVDLRNNQSDFRRITVWTTGHLQMQRSTDGASWS